MIVLWSRRYVRHLEAEIEWFKLQVEHERQRAELAVDELLRVRVGAGPVTQTTPGEAKAAQTIVDKMLSDTEFAEAGNA